MAWPRVFLHPTLGAGILYDLRDEFMDTRAAGSVDGTPATPGPGDRVVADTGSNISVGSGVLNFAGGTSVWGETVHAWDAAIERPTGYVRGRRIEFDVVADNDAAMWVGLATDTAPGDPSAADCEHALLFNSDGNIDVIAGGTTVKADAMAYTNGTTYRVRLVLYEDGCFYAVSDDGSASFTALYEDVAENTATLYAAISNYNAVFTADRVRAEQRTITESFADCVADVPIAQARALRTLHRDTDGGNWTDRTNWLSDTTVGNWYGITVSGGYVTQIGLSDEGATLDGSFDAVAWDELTSLTRLYLHNTNVSGDITNLSGLTSLTRLVLYNTNISGDITNLSGLTSLTHLQAYDNGGINGDIANLSGLTSLTVLHLGNTNISGDIANLSGLTSLTYLVLFSTSISGDISDLSGLTSLTSLNLFSTGISGDIANLSGLTSLTALQLYNTSISGDIANLSGLTSLTILYLGSTNVSGGDISANVAMQDCWVSDCGWDQATVDAFLQAMYNARANYTYATPNLNIGGSNATPSGTYQDGDPPTTGLEYVYELANDPELEGFNTWTITYNGGSAP